MDVKVFNTLSIIFVSLIISSAFADKNPVVATVNGTNIRYNTLMRNYEGAKFYVSAKKVTKEAILNELINRELGIQKAKKEKLNSNDIVKNKMEDILYHAQISKDLEKQLGQIQVSEEEVKKYYGDNPEYRTAHILFRTKAVASPNELKAAVDVAAKVYRQVLNEPQRFAEFANKYSQSQNAETGGDIGYRPAGMLAPEYYNAIKGKKVNFITQPVKTQYGLHIIKVLGEKKYSQINREVYEKLVYDIKRDKILGNYFSSLRSNASIKIEKKFLK